MHALSFPLLFLQSGSKLLSFDQQHAHFLTTSQRNDFSCISPPTMGNKSNAARRNRNKHQGSPFESQNEPTAVASSSKRVKRSKQIDISMTINKTCQLPILLQKGCPKIQLIILNNTSRLCTVLCSETQLLMKILRRSDCQLGEFIYRQFDVQGSSHQKHRQSYFQGSFRVRKALQ